MIIFNMKIDIKVIPNAMDSRQNLLQPDWDAIADWVEGNIDPSDFHDAYLHLDY